MATITPARTSTPRVEVITLDPNTYPSICAILADLEHGLISHDEAHASIDLAFATGKL